MSDVFAYSRASLAAIDRTVLRSSDDAGWTSLLVERHVVTPESTVVDIPSTPDQTIVVGCRGAERISVRSIRGWKHATYGVGTVGLTTGGHGEELWRRRAGGCRTFEKINIYVPESTVRSVIDDWLSAGAHPRTQLNDLGLHDPTISTFAHGVVRAIGSGAPDLYAESAARWIIAHLVSLIPGTDADARRKAPAPLTRVRISAVLERIHAEYASALTLDRLAAEAHVSKHHFARLFRQAAGVTPHAYLITVRLDAARDLLAGTDLTVGQIASRCGYRHPAHFAGAFAGRFGVTPGDYRRSVRSTTGPTLPAPTSGHFRNTKDR